MRDLTEKDLESMKNHKYQNNRLHNNRQQNESILDKMFIIFLRNINPNMVTATGLFCEIMKITIIGLNDLTLSKKSSIIYLHFNRNSNPILHMDI